LVAMWNRGRAVENVEGQPNSFPFFCAPYLTLVYKKWVHATANINGRVTFSGERCHSVWILQGTEVHSARMLNRNWWRVCWQRCRQVKRTKRCWGIWGCQQ
jgi:hypothetical protein